uniref:CCHC-type domain-containing protein n=1 Tax=Rhizophagus irregularis (strain DAOM 181602 / DAOM 197198 / MUCL 43194) TaxID=747089 RepID=U9SW30_RHIID
MEIETDNEEISIGIREQEQDTRQILLRSLVLTIPMEAILKVWNRLVYRHFFRVGTYSRFATFHICMIPNRWYINPDVELNDLLQQYPFIPIDSHGSQPSQPAVNSPKTMYAELARLLKKAIDYALKSDKQQELLNIFKAFIYDVKSELEPENFTDVINPKHKGQPPKRLISSVEKVLNREKRVLKDVSNSNVIEDNNTSNIIEDFTNDTKGQKCSKCKQYGHYAKTCQNVI